MKKEDKIVMDQYAIGETKAVEPSKPTCDKCGKFTDEREGQFTVCGTAWVCPSCKTELDEMDEEPTVKPPSNFDVIESLDFIWDKLHGYREDCIPESNPDYDEEWSDICISMAWIEGGCDVERVEGILEPKNNNKTKKVTKSSKILSGRDKVIIEMQIEYDVPQGLSYAEKVQFTEDLELPTGYVEDSFGIVEFSNKKESK